MSWKYPNWFLVYSHPQNCHKSKNENSDRHIVSTDKNFLDLQVGGGFVLSNFVQ